MNPILAPRFSPRTVVGVVSPCSPAGEILLNGTRAYWEGRGHRVVVGRHATAELGGYLAGSREERAADLNAMIADPDIGLIVPAMGGKGGSQLLPLLDYATFAARPSLFIGSSDPSILALALYARTGVVTFHGPTGMCYPAMTDYAERAMDDMLAGAVPLGEALPKATEWRTIREGDPVSGPLLGGHLGTIRALIGTPYEPDWTGAILFLEEIDTEFHDIDASLTHLALHGVFDSIAALVVGRPVNVSERYWTSTETLDDIVLRACQGTAFPIVTDVDLGHTPDKLTLPVGLGARLDPAAPALSVIAPAVS